ncbi:MAG: M1 family peptidase, partial [Streptosporangiaceae bacterium]
YAGNGGFDVRHYALNLSYKPSTHHLAGTAVVCAVATENLDRFDLDLRRDMAVSRVTVNGHRARYARSGRQELVITPRPKLHAGRPFAVRVSYAGKAESVTDPDGSSEGWIPTDDGAFVVGEPQGSPSWFPCSDHPTDKATFTTRVRSLRGKRWSATACSSRTGPRTATRLSSGTKAIPWRRTSPPWPSAISRSSGR